MVVGAGFEPANSERTDLQSACFSHLHIPPKMEKTWTVGPFADLPSNFFEISIVAQSGLFFKQKNRESGSSTVASRTQAHGQRTFSFKNLPQWMRGRFDDGQRFLMLCICAGVLCGLVGVSFHLAITELFNGLFQFYGGLGIWASQR